uniref:Uncharacterized protein n=1 Tax=Phasianus colchicus TaxID=9054 RepID=A0A669QF84_PHACC
MERGCTGTEPTPSPHPACTERAAESIAVPGGSCHLPLCHRSTSALSPPVPQCNTAPGVPSSTNSAHPTPEPPDPSPTCGADPCCGAGAVLWVRSWRSRWDLRLKPRPHCSQVKGRAPACALVWAMRLGRELKQRPHCRQAKGRSPVCTRRCRSRCWLWAKPRPQSGQAKGRSPVCVRWCVARLGLWLKVLSQCGQAYGFSPMCPRRCAVRCRLSPVPRRPPAAPRHTAPPPAAPALFWRWERLHRTGLS